MLYYFVAEKCNGSAKRRFLPPGAPMSRLVLLALSACATSSDPADIGNYGTDQTSGTGDTTGHTSATVTVEQGACSVYEWTLTGDVVERLAESVISSSVSFTGAPGSMMEVDCSNSYIAPRLEPIVSWSADSCVINMVCDGSTEDDTCDRDDVWFYANPSSVGDPIGRDCYAGTETGRG